MSRPDIKLRGKSKDLEKAIIELESRARILLNGLGLRGQNNITSLVEATIDEVGCLLDAMRRQGKSRLYPKLQVRVKYLLSSLEKMKLPPGLPDTALDAPNHNELRLETKQIDWSDVCFRDRFIQVWFDKGKRPLDLKLEESRSSLEHIKSAFARYPIKPLVITVKDGGIQRVDNLEEFKRAILFLSIEDDVADFFSDPNTESVKSIWSLLRGVSNADIINHYKLNDRGPYFRHLCTVHDNQFKIVPAVESFPKGGYSGNPEHGFIFTLRRGSNLFFAWESTLENRATFIFRTEERSYENSLQRLFDFIASDQTRKRTKLRLNAHKPNPLGVLGKIIHANKASWQVGLAKLMRSK